MRLRAAVLAAVLASMTPGCAGCFVSLDLKGPVTPSLLEVGAKGDALALSDALEALIAESKDTPTDREYALKTIRAHMEDTAAYAFARAAVAGRVVQSKGLGGVGLVSEVEHWAERSRKLDSNFREGAATRMLGTLYTQAPSSLLEHGDSEQGLEMLEGLVKAHPNTLENHLRLAEAYVFQGDPGSAKAYLCRCAAGRARLRRDDQALLDHLLADAGHPQC